MPSSDLYAFEITVHRLSVAPTVGQGPPLMHTDDWGTWPTLRVPHAGFTAPLGVGFDETLARLGRLERMFVEPDGSFVWTGASDGRPWQVDGNAVEMDGRLLLVDVKGACPAAEFDRLLACFGWPEERLMMLLVRPGAVLGEDVFREHALARARASCGDDGRSG